MIFKKKKRKPELTTLEHYRINFKTVDGEYHKYSLLPFADPSTLNCSVPYYYMTGRKALMDDSGAYYPLSNIISYKFTKDQTLNNVVMLYDDAFGCHTYGQTWYQNEEIEIYREEEE